MLAGFWLQNSILQGNSGELRTSDASHIIGGHRMALGSSGLHANCYFSLLQKEIEWRRNCTALRYSSRTNLARAWHKVWNSPVTCDCETPLLEDKINDEVKHQTRLSRGGSSSSRILDLVGLRHRLYSLTAIQSMGWGNKMARAAILTTPIFSRLKNGFFPPFSGL